MSIRVYPKHQFVVEIDGESKLLNYIPSFTGYLKHIRVKMLKRNYSDQTSYAVINILVNTSDGSSNEEIVATSERVYYKDIGSATNAVDYYHALVRFDFSENLILSGKEYTIQIVQSSYTSDENSFVAYCLDYNYPINQTLGPISPVTNLRLAAEIYLMKDYYEFI